MKVPKYIPPVCEHCHQTTGYALNLDKGIAYLLIAIYNRVKHENRNRIHIQNEMAVARTGTTSVKELTVAGLITFKMEKNVARARKHGLIAFVERGSGEYLITRKGADFLRGKRIPRTAIVTKSEGTDGYWHPETNTVTIGELLKSEAFWDVEYLNETYPLTVHNQQFAGMTPE